MTEQEEVRRRLDDNSQRITRMEERQAGHELLCAQRYGQIARDLASIAENLASVTKWGAWISFALFMIELGKATFPALTTALKIIGEVKGMSLP